MRAIQHPILVLSQRCTPCDMRHMRHMRHASWVALTLADLAGFEAIANFTHSSKGLGVFTERS